MPLELNAYNDCFISGKFLTVVLLQVLPGKEEEVFRRIKTWKPSISVYKGLGRYDLVLVDEASDLSLLNDFRGFPQTSIIDVNYICGFQWLNNITTPEKIGPTEKPMLGICCIKLKNEQNAHQMKKEQNLTNAIHKKALEGDSNIVVYGGFGWNEVITLVRCSSVSELTRGVHNIREALLSEDSNSFLDTSTIPCIDFSFIADNRLNELKEKIDVTILIGSRQPESDVLEFCNRQFGDVSTAFGFHDFVIFCKQLSMGSYLEKILFLRKQSGLLYTYSVLMHANEIKEAKSKKIDADLPANISPNANTSVRQIVLSDHETNLVKHFINLFDVLRNDPLTYDLFPNIGIWDRLFKKIDEIRKYEKKDPDEYRKALQVFYSNIDCLRTLFIERYMDVPLANLLGGKSPVSEIFGGSSRLVKAAESIPIFFSKVVGEDWQGVCIHGYYDRYYRLYAGIINVPGKDLLLKPERFWGLYHESGHEVYNLLKDHVPKWHLKIEKVIKDQLRLFEATDKAKLAEQNRLLRWGMSEKEKTNELKRDMLEEERKTRHIANELFAELFSFRFGFAGDWKIWKEEVWSWFTTEFGPRVEFLTRSILLALTLGPAEGFWPEQKRQRIEAIIKDLETTTPATKESKGIDNDVKKNARINVGKFLEIALSIKKILKSVEVSSEVPRESLLQIFDRLAAGIPVKVINNETDVTPATVINALVLASKDSTRSDKAAELRTKVAAIMSLYNYYIAFR